MMNLIHGLTKRGKKITRHFEGRKEGRVLFNDVLDNTFFTVIWRRKHGKGTLSEIGNPLPPHGLLFPISNKDYFICSIRQIGEHITQPLLHQSWSTGQNEK